MRALLMEISVKIAAVSLFFIYISLYLYIYCWQFFKLYISTTCASKATMLVVLPMESQSRMASLRSLFSGCAFETPPLLYSSRNSLLTGPIQTPQTVTGRNLIPHFQDCMISTRQEDAAREAKCSSLRF